MKKMRFLLALILLAAMLTTLTACKEKIVVSGGDDPAADDGAMLESVETPTQTDKTEAEPEPEPVPTSVTVVLSVPLGTDTLSPYFPDTGAEYRMVLDCVYLRGMYRINGALISDVLSYWEQTGSYSWRLRLREGITDSDGNAFTAEDMVHCLPSESNTLASIGAVDELTVELTFATTAHNALEMLLSNTYLVTDEARSAPGVLPAGFGRYIAEEFDGKGGLCLVRREDYWQQDEGRITPVAVANAEIINFVYEEDIILRTSYSARGDADLVCGLDQYNANLVSDGCYQYVAKEKSTVALFFNMDEERLMVTKPALRDAVACAIDRTALFTVGDKADGLLPNDTVGYTPRGYAEQDIEAAKDHMSSARYRGQILTLICTQEHAAAAELIIQQCTAIGLKVELQVVDGDVKSAAADADWDMAIAEIDVVGDAASSYAVCFAAQDDGATWFNLSRNDVLYVASVIATTAGHNSDNIEMFETWLASEPVVLGLYTPGAICLIADSAGDPIVGDNGIVIGSLLPKEPVTE